jgi:hypothetical protein
VPLPELYSQRHGHLLVLGGPPELALQFAIQHLNSLVLSAQVSAGGIGTAEAVQNGSANPMAGVTLELHSLARVKLVDGIHEPQDAVGAKVIHFYMGREMSVNPKSYASY